MRFPRPTRASWTFLKRLKSICPYNPAVPEHENPRRTAGIFVKTVLMIFEYELGHRFLQGLAGAELGLHRGGDLNLLAGLGVAALPGGPLGYAESAETGDGHVLAATHGLRNGVEYRLHRPMGLGLGLDSGRFHYGLHQSFFGHFFRFGEFSTFGLRK